MRATLLIVVGCMVVGSAASAAPAPVTVFLDRAGGVVDHDGAEVEIPAFGGGDRAWTGIVACVRRELAPFRIEIVDREPAGGDHITAMIGGRASLLGLDDATTNGVGPYAAGRVLRDAVVHVFSRVGTGEHDVENLCAATVHEVAHALGLDHSYLCGDVMSYFLDRCGPRRILDRDAPCGEESPRACGDGARTQNSYQKLAAAVGLRDTGLEVEPGPAPVLDDPDDPDDPWATSGHAADADDPGDAADADDPGDAADADDFGDAADADDSADDAFDRGDRPDLIRGPDGHVYRVRELRDRRGQRWVVIRRVR